MSEKSDFTISFSDIYNDETTKVNTFKEKINVNNYPIRCSHCSKIPILNADFKNNYYCTICENKHKNNYNSFSSFLEDSNKDLNLIVCNICLKSKGQESLLKCHDCNLFFCYDCKNIHQEKSEHIYYEESNKIDNFCGIHNEKHKYYDVKNQRHLCKICYQEIEDKNNIIEIGNILENKERINKEYKKAIENNLICKNIQKQLFNWLNDLTKRVKIVCETLNNYHLIYISMLNSLKNDNIHNNNFNSIINYESFNKNKNNIDLYIHQIYKRINNFSIINTSFETISKNYINILNSFDKIDFSVESENIKEENNYKKLNMLDDNESEFNKQIKRKKLPIIKIEEMKSLKLEFNSEAKSFCSLNNDNILAIGLKSGKIEVYEFIQEESFKSKIKINEFQNEIKFICELDINIFAATDSKTRIKIIKLTDNMTNYIVIQTLTLKDDSESIYTMINLPILSYKEKRHYFCTGDEKHILIWKSNKQPQNIAFMDFFYENQMEKKRTAQSLSILEEMQKNQEDILKKDEPLYFTLVKDIELNTLTHCIIEVNEKYIAAACTKDNTIKIFNVQNNFKKVAEIKKKIPISCGSNILSLPNEQYLMVGCTNGFYLISTQDFHSTKEIQCKYSVTCIETIRKNEILCCCVEKNNNKIKHYKIEDNLDLIKSSEKKVHKNEIWNLKVINKRIFYTNNNNDIIYLK